MIAWFTRNGVAANLLMITILCVGIYSANNRIPMETFPDIRADRISINMSLRGATPEDVEQGITMRIEESIQNLEGIKRMFGYSSEGDANVVVEVEPGYNSRDLLADIKSRVDSINTFPAEAERPVIALDQETQEVILVTVSSEYGEKETREYAETIRDDLLAIPEITQAALIGTRNYEISIEVKQDKLRQYELTIDQIANAINRSSLDISSGNLRTVGGDVLVRSKGQGYRKDDFTNIQIKVNPDGSILRLEDVANIRDEFEESPVRSHFNGNPAVFVEIYRIGQQSAIEISDLVKSYVEERKNNLPQGFEISTWDDDAQNIKNRLSTITKNAIQGGVLVVIMLTLFLRPSIAFWVFVGIPIAFMGAFIMMPFFGVSFNFISLFGFILVLGIVVDDAIVTGENIYTNMKTAETSEMAAITGTKQVAAPVTFGILTTVASFMPLIFMAGDRGAMFAQISYVVIPVLLFSLIESKLILPSHLKHTKLEKDKQKEGGKFAKFQKEFADGFERAILKYYNPLLSKALKNKMTTISIYFGVLIIMGATILSGWTQFIFFPRIAGESVEMGLTMPAGTPFDLTNKHVINIAEKAEILRDKYVMENGESIITNIMALAGDHGNANEGEIQFELVPLEQRLDMISSPDLANEWRDLVGDVPGAEKVTYRAESGRASDPIDVMLTASSIPLLDAVSERVKEYLATRRGVFDISDSMSDGKQELQIELTEQGEALGLTREGISRQVRQALFGAEVQRIQRGRNDVRVMVRLPIEERKSIAGLQGLLIGTPDGGLVPLEHVATLISGQSPSTIIRTDRYRTVNVTADIEKGNVDAVQLQAELEQYMDQLVNEYPGLRYSLEGEAREQEESFASLIYGAVFVLFIIYALLAIPFKSYTQPFIVMGIIPFGIIGAVAGHWLMRMDLSIMSVLGMMALIGVVVNDSLVLVDYINKRRKVTNDLFRSVVEAGTARFRPVFLTSITTFIGLVPILFEKSSDAQFIIPMAVSLGFGILFATVITLFLVPVNYLLLEQLKEKIHFYIGQETASTAG